MREEYYLLIDIGTGNTVVAIGDSKRNIVDFMGFSNEYERDLAYENSLVFSPEKLLDKIIVAIKNLLGKNEIRRIESIICDSPRQSFVLLDENKKAIIGMPNIDNRGKEFIEKYSDEKLKEKVYTLSGHPLTEDFGAMKLVATRERQKEIFNKSRWFISISEWLGSVFTEKLSMEYSHAGETQLFNIKENRWDEELCEIFNIDIDILPEVVSSGKVLGSIKNDFTTEFGLDSQTDFIVGGADTQFALEGIGDINKSDLVIVSGTTTPIIKLRNNPIYDYENNIWNGKHCGGEKYMVESNPGVTGLNYQNFKEIFAHNISYDELENQYLKIKNPRVVASLTSQITLKAKGSIRGGFYLTPPNSNNITIYDFMYGILCDNVCAIYEKFKILNEKEKNNLVVGCGGGFQSENFTQNLANLIGLPISLNEGFSKSSLMGLLNKSVKNKNNEELFSNTVKTYYPKEGTYIHLYYEKWLESVK
ncbi:FGGY-family carbohydrate kinase [Anaerosphaera multitolerans]|uniref:Carbohydrate kinase FGGY N-terminal domain-containing protein n=1 Tax=Anaerosphaera multitolerans TaxID=2487351 RepID=A0A437S5B1_9FIRM|nr:FGGY family carbohydrate kinase [Anaerosphaera multitolerans]RVU54213.1 hypothetical protein EF514_08510 [Anaerosphaera multitolerans]